jgi:hypothetical protein
MRYAGLVESRSPQSSQSIDEIVYGNKDWCLPDGAES